MEELIAQVAQRAAAGAQQTYDNRFAKDVILAKAGQLNRTNSVLSNFASFNSEAGFVLANDQLLRPIGANFVSTAGVQASNGAAYSLNRS